jgi:hypothetical protein
LSDVELVGQDEPVQLNGPETISFACGRYVDAYNTLSAIMSRFYEHDIEWLIEEVAKPEEYRRDLEHFLGGHPLHYGVPTKERSDGNARCGRHGRNRV